MIKDATIFLMNHLSTAPYKGSRDYYPSDKRIQNYIFTTWSRVVQQYGYEEYGAPTLEPLEIYTAKSGQELASEQTYTFSDRGGRSVAIRPEMTPSISRMVAARRQEIGYPARLYSIANFMRYERPQRGREREFWQLNTDIFGVDSIQAEAEIITMAYELVMAFGAKADMFTIYVNNRKLIEEIMSRYLGLDPVAAQLMIKLFDRRSKISPEQFTAQAIDIFGSQQADAGLAKLAKLVAARTVDELPKELQASSSIADLKQLFDILKSNGVKNVEFAVTLMRGLDYYTGTVFEVFDNHPDNNRSMFGGGRYDGLVGLFGVEPVATVGMAPGATMFYNFLEVHGLLPDLASTTHVAIIMVGDVFNETQAIARELRSEGVNVEIDLTGRKFEKQAKAIEKRRVPFMMVLGEHEIKEHLYSLKHLPSGNEQKLSLERIIAEVKDHRKLPVHQGNELNDLLTID